MSKLEEFYRALIKDPDLEIKAGQTREQAAQQEAEYRARQYHNNEQALSMATEPEKSSIDSLLDFMSKEYLGVSDEGIKNFHRNMPEVFGPEVKEKKVVRKPAEYDEPPYEFEYDEDRTDKLGAIGEIERVQPSTPEHPEQKEAKKSKVKESTDYTGAPVYYKTGKRKGTKKTKATGKPEITPKLRNFIDYIYGIRAKQGKSSAETDELISNTFNNPNWFEDTRTIEQITTQVNAIEDRQNKAREQDAEARQKFYTQDETRKASERPRTIGDRLLAGESPSRARQDNDPHVERYAEIKESLGNNNKKSAEAIWEKDGSIEQARFNNLPNELKPVLSNLHSTASAEDRLTPAQQLVLLNLVESESSDVHVTGIHDNMKNPITGDWNMSNDPGANAAARLKHDQLLEQNKHFREEDFYSIISDVMNQIIRNADSLELSQNQLIHLDDRLSGDNLLTDVRTGQKDLAPLDGSPSDIPDSSYPYKNEITGNKKPGKKAKKWLDNAKKSLFPGQSRVSNELLASKLQQMANEGLFEADNEIYKNVKGAKAEFTTNKKGEQKHGWYSEDGEAIIQNPSAITALFEQKHPAFNNYVATPNQKKTEEKLIAQNKRAQSEANKNPDDTKKQKEAIETQEKVNELSQTDNKKQVNKDNEEALKDENIEVINDANHTEKLSENATEIGRAYTNAAFGSPEALAALGEEEEAGDTTGRLEILPHDMDHSGDKSPLTEINKRKQDLLKKLNKGWASFSKRDESGEWDIFPDAVSSFDEAEQNIFEKYYGIDINAGNIPDSTDVTERTSIPKTNSELDQFSLEEIGTLAEMLVENNDDIRDKTDAEDIKDVMAWGGKNKSKYEQDIRDEINSQSFKDAVSLDNLNREADEKERQAAEARRQERQNLIDAGQRDLFPEGPQPESSSDDDSSEGGDGEEETVVEEPAVEEPVAEEVTPESDAEKIESLNLIRDGKNFREMDENGNPDKSKPIVREIEINGEKKYIASIKDGSDTIWYEHTEENKNSSQKGDEDSTGNTRNDLVAKLQAQADSKAADTAAEAEAPAEAEASAEAEEDDTTVETETEAEEGDTTVETETEATSADGGSDETNTDTTESSTDEQVEGVGEVSAEGSGGEQVDSAAQGDAEGSGEDTPTIPPAIKSQLDKAEKKKLIRHAYEKELGLNKGEEDDFHKYEAYKKEFIEEYSDKPIEKLNKKLGQIGKSIRQIEAKAADAAKKADDKEKKDNLKIKQQEEKERLDRIRDEKNADEERENNIAYGETEEAQQARDEAHATSGANLFTHFNDKGEVSHETHGEAIGDESKHNHFDEHDKKESGSHPAHHHNKEILDKNIPPALREIKEEEGKEEPNEQIISKNRQFLQQKNQEGYVWNHNTNHWIHRENLSGLMAGHVGNNATLANGNHVGKSGKATFLDGSGNAAQGIFHLGTGYNVHQLGQGVVGKHIANEYNKSGTLKQHLKSNNTFTKIGNASSVYESSGIGVPKARATTFSAGRALARQGAESGFNVTPVVAAVRNFFGLKKGELSNSALQQLVESYSGKNKKR